MLYLILVGIVAWGASVGGAYWYGGHEAVTAYQAKEQVAQQKIDDQAKKLVDDAVQRQAEVVAAFDKGRTEGQAQAKVVYVKGMQYVASDKGLSNPACVMGADAMQYLQLARTDLRAASLASVPTTGLPGPGSDPRSNDGGHVQPDVAGRGAVPGVPQQPAPVRSTGEVPRLSLPAHPKPTPVH